MVWKPAIIYVVNVHLAWVPWRQRRWSYAKVESGGKQIGEVIGESHHELLSKARALWHQHGETATTPTVLVIESFAGTEVGRHDPLLLRCLNCGAVAGEVSPASEVRNLEKVCPRCAERALYTMATTTSFMYYQIIKPGEKRP